LRSGAVVQETSRREISLHTVDVDANFIRIRRREERCFEICEGMTDLTAALFHISSKELRRPGRAAAGVARARQIAMYVAHVALGLSMNEIGRGFGRDRTTVSHACHRVEDLRDEIEFDRIVHTVEQVAQAAFGGRMERIDG